MKSLTQRFAAAGNAAQGRARAERQELRRMIIRALCVTSLLMVSQSLVFSSQKRHDPLTELEGDQLRETAQAPSKRLPLFLGFIRQRADKLELVANDPRFQPDRGARMHDLLDEIDILMQELDDNIDQFAAQRYDIRKPLKLVIDWESTFAPKLESLLEKTEAPGEKEYEVVLRSALDSLSGSLENARKVRDTQEEAIRKAKERENQKK